MTTLLTMTRRSIAVALVAGLAMALLLSSGGSLRTRPAATRVLDYTPVTGAIFNRPVGTTAQQRAIFTHVNNTIDATPPGATIRFAVYSFSEKATATKLLNAYNRGVNVQLIFDGHQVFPQETRLQQTLGKNPNKRSFAMFCADSCRGTKGVMHQKVFLFDKAGKAENVVMVGSNNMTLYNATKQWSDIYTVVGDPAMYFMYSGVFEQMKTDTPQTSPYIQAEVNGYEPEFYPRPRTTQANDPISQDLSKITCTGATPGFGTDTKVDSDGDGVTDWVTSLRLSHHAWNGERGKYLAQQVAGLFKQGCDVRIVYGVGIGRVVKSILTNAGIPMSSGKHKGIHTHQKAMYLSGVFDGDPSSAIVWNGSHNWSDGALRRDDVVLRIQSQDVYNQYLANFNDMWTNG